MAVVVRILLALLLVVVLLLAAGGVTLSLLDWNARRDRVASLVEYFTAWQVVRLGGLHVALWSPLRIEVTAFELRETSEQPALAMVEGDRVALALNPSSLLGRLRIEELELQGVSVLLRTPAEAPEPPEETELPYIARASVEDLTVTYTPHTGEPLHAHIAALNLSGAEAAKRLSLAGNGELQELPFEVAGQIGLDPDDGSAPVLFDLELDITGVRAEIAGAAGTSPAFDIEVAVSEGDPAVIAAAFGVELGEVPPYRLRARIAESAGKLLVPEFQNALGESDIRGEVMVDTEREQPLIQARLVAERLRHADLMALLPPADAIGEQSEAPESAADPPARPLFSDTPFDFARLRSVDAELELAVEEYVGGSAGRALQRIKLEGRLEQGRLVVKPFEVSVADGTLGTSLLFDAADDQVELQAAIAATGIDLTTLVAPFVGALDATELIHGEFSTKAEFRATGASSRELVRSLNGGVVLAMESGAITQALVEAVGLDLPEALVKWFSEKPLTDIQCAIGIVDIESGIVSVEQMLLATTDSNVVVEGQLDLPAEQIDLTLQAHAKDVSFGAGDNPIRFTGPLTDMNVDLVSGRLAASLIGSAVLAVVNPLLSVLPLFESGETEGSRCDELDAELRRIVRVSEQQAEESAAGAESEAGQR